jgi:hypothetical protein
VTRHSNGADETTHPAPTFLRDILPDRALRRASANWSVGGGLSALTPVGLPWSLSFLDQELLTTLYLRTNLTERQLAVLFDISQKQVDRVLHDLLNPPGNLLDPAPTDERELWIVDGTLLPTRDRTRTALGKTYRRSVNVQVVARRRDRRVVAVGEAWPGNRNDSVVFRATVDPR